MKRTNNKGLKLLLLSLVMIVLVSMKSHSAYAKDVRVTLPTFDVTINNVKIENAYRKYPFIVHKDITYVPMTWTDSRFLGLETNWSSEKGLEIIHTGYIGSYANFKPDIQKSKNVKSAVASLPTFTIKLNGKVINNAKEPYPLLLYRDITYFPLTWRFGVDEFDWGYHFTHKEGLKIDMVKGYGDSTVTYEKFKAIKVGDTTRGDLERLFSQGLQNIPNELFPRHGSQYLDHSYEIVDTKTPSYKMNVELYPGWYLEKNPTDIVFEKVYNGYYDRNKFEYSQVIEKNLQKLEEGMNYESVRTILGGEGMLIREHKNYKYKSTDLDRHYRNYQWFGVDLQHPISVSFEKVGDQFILKDVSYSRDYSNEDRSKYPEVAKEKFHQLEVGMNYESVRTILGEKGLLSSVSGMSNGQQRKLYSNYIWYGTNLHEPIHIEFEKSGKELVLTEIYYYYNDHAKSYEEFEYPQVIEENFEKLEEGMSYESVRTILGGEGMLTWYHLSNEQGHTSQYKWYGLGLQAPIEVRFNKVGEEFILSSKHLYRY